MRMTKYYFIATQQIEANHLAICAKGSGILYAATAWPNDQFSSEFPAQQVLPESPQSEHGGQ